MDYKKRMPEKYYEPIENRGRIEEITYPSKVYSGEEEPAEKRALVYLPKGYDDNTVDAYRVLYLMHGGGGDYKEFLCGQVGKQNLITILDHMIDEGLLKPLIVVTPSFYYSDSQSAMHDIKEAGILTKFFHNEFRNDLLHVIDEKYRTIPDRDHRAFGGFSMGSETTWEVMINCLDLVKHYMPLSGDCWIVEEKGGATYPEKTSELMKAYIKDKGFDNLSYNIFAYTGDQDIAYPALNAQIEAMLKDGWDNGSDKRLRFGSWEEGVHWYPFIYEYIYNILPDLF